MWSLDKLFIASLILCVPTMPFFRLEVGSLKAPVIVFPGLLYIGLKTGALLASQEPLKPMPFITLIFTTFLIWGAMSIHWADDARYALRLLVEYSFLFGLTCFTLNTCDIQIPSLSKLMALLPYAILVPIVIGFYGYFANDSFFFAFVYEQEEVIGNKNAYAFICITALPVCVPLLLNSSRSFILRSLSLLIILVVALVIFLIVSRAAVVCAILICLVVLMGACRLSKGLPAAVASVGFALAFLACLWPMTQSVLQKTDGGVGVGDEWVRKYDRTGNENRMALLRGGMEIVSKRPLTGVGLNSFQSAFGRLVPDAGKESAAHNSYNKVAVELGLVGLAMFCVMVFWPLSRLLRAFPRVKSATEHQASEQYLIGIGFGALLVVSPLMHDMAGAAYYWIIYLFTCIIVRSLDSFLSAHQNYARTYPLAG
jgi:O-antigen ligase